MPLYQRDRVISACEMTILQIETERKDRIALAGLEPTRPAPAKTFIGAIFRQSQFKEALQYDLWASRIARAKAHKSEQLRTAKKILAAINSSAVRHLEDLTVEEFSAIAEAYSATKKAA